MKCTKRLCSMQYNTISENCDALTEKQLYNDKGYCSDFEDKTQPKKTSLWWKCERCGKLIQYMADFCHECAYELLGEPPKPFGPQEERSDKG